MVSIRGEQLVVVAPPGESLRFGPEDVDQAEELHRVLSLWIAGVRSEQSCSLPRQQR